ncbi:MAG: hypothetical protein J07HB67_01095, partial [halophilic archaeon J07HB67]
MKTTHTVDPGELERVAGHGRHRDDIDIGGEKDAGIFGTIATNSAATEG